MSEEFPIFPTPKLKRTVEPCPLLANDREAWIICCSRRFFPLARRIAGNDSLAEDVLQTSWVKILQSVNHACFDGPKACPWVHRVVANTAHDVHRERVRRREVPLEEGQTLKQDLEAFFQERELLILLEEMIQLLPDTYRQVLELRLRQGLSNQQMAERLHISLSSVSTRLNRAVNLLRRYLDARIQSLPSRS